MTKNVESVPEFRSLSLFTGAGGMDIGLERAGFGTIGFIEIDEAANETLQVNRPDWIKLGDGDINSVSSDLTPDDLGLRKGELDLISGGPPCQPFSTAAQWSYNGRQGMADSRAATVHSLLELLERFEPRALMFENVHGFVNGPSSALPFFERKLSEIRAKTGTEYVLDWRLLNAADFGVPQNRRRVLIVLLRSDCGPFEWPDAHYGEQPMTAWDALGDLEEVDVPVPQGKWTGLLPSIPEGWNYQWHTEKGGGEELFGYRTKYWNFLLKLARDRPSWTLAASPGPSTGPFHWNNRPLSPREMMRLQTFPDDWTLAGDYRTQVKLAGNATPSLLAEVVGRQIAAALRGHELQEPASLTRSRLTPPEETLVLRDVPKDYLGLRGSKAKHPGTGLGPAGRPLVVKAQV